MTTVTNKNIFYSESDKLIVFETEPLPNRTYTVNTDTTDTYNLKMIGDSIRLTDAKGNEKVRLKQTKKRPRTDDDQTDYILNWLDKRCPDMKNLEHLFNPENEKEHIIIKGYVQSGKTSFMLCSALKYMFGPSSMSSVIILRDSIGDSTQIASRLRDMKQMLKEYLRDKNVSDEIDFTVLGDRVSFVDFDAAMSGINPKIFVVLGNGSQLRRINKLMKKVESPNVAVFIDEADSNDTGENHRTDEMAILKETASRVFYISATILEIGLREDDNSVYMLEDVPHYMGIEKLIHRPIAENAVPNNRKEDDPFENDPNIGGFISIFEKLEPHRVDFLDTYHPQHCLISCGAVILPQQKLFSFISVHDITVLIYNGQGVELYHRSLDGEKIHIKNGNGRNIHSEECKWRPGAHTFGKTIAISNVLQWLKDNGGVERFPRIITISGKLAGRGISFVSDDYGRYLGEFLNNSPPKWVGWRLTSMYYVPSALTSQPNIMQCAGRVCCVVRDNIPTYIYSNDEALMDLRKAYWTQEELVIRARKLQDGDDINIGEAMHQIKMNNTKLSKRRLTVNGAKRLKDVNVLEWYQDDEGFKIEDTYEKHAEIDSGWDIVPKSINVQNSDEEIINMSLEEWTRLTTKMFVTWSQDSSNISGFMASLDPDKIYTKSEMKELCLHNNIRMGDVVIDKSGKSNKYGSIISCTSRKYVLYPELVNSYKLNF
jgi:hypothetical protein